MRGNKVETRYIRLGDNRRISFCEYGDPQGKPVFYFHGTPGSRNEPKFNDQQEKNMAIGSSLWIDRG